MPPAQATHHHSHSIKRLHPSHLHPSGTFSLVVNITRTWGHYESKEMAGFAAALLLARVPDYELSRKLNEARVGLDLGPVAALPLHSLIARPLSMAVTLPPLRPVPVGTWSPAAAEPVAPDGDAPQVLARLATPAAWATIISGICHRAPGVEVSEPTIAAIAARFAQMAAGPRYNRQGSVADAIGAPDP